MCPVPPGERLTPPASNQPGMSSAYMPFRIDVNGMPESWSICSVAPCDRACRKIASGPAATNER